jgi:hypothetical protein
VLVEIQERDKLAIQADVAAAVDALVRSYPLEPEIRSRDSNGSVRVEKAPAPSAMRPGFGQPTQQGFRRLTQSGGMYAAEVPTQPRQASRAQPANRRPLPGDRATFERGFPQLSQLAQPSEPSLRLDYPGEEDLLDDKFAPPGENGQPGLLSIRLFPYGVARNRLMQSAKRLGVPAVVVRELTEADALLTLRTYYRGRQQTILEAEQRGLPIYVLRANTNSQIEQLLAEIFNLSYNPNSNEDWQESTLQTQAAIQMVMNGERYVDLAPASPAIRRMQHEQARAAQLTSHSYGKEPNRRVRIYRE